MLFLWSIIISLGIMPYAVRYGAVKVRCLTTGDSKVIGADIYFEKTFADGPIIMINNQFALCKVFVHARGPRYIWKNGKAVVNIKRRIFFSLNCACRHNERKIHRVKRFQIGKNTGVDEYEGFLSCDARNRPSLWWAMRFSENKILDIPFVVLGIAPSEYACGAHANAWQNNIISPLHRFFGLDGHQCCEGHDACYGNCKSKKRHCDVRFKKCLFLSCKHHGLWRTVTCHFAASLSSAIVGSPLSNKAFKTAQEGCEHVGKQK